MLPRRTSSEGNTFVSDGHQSVGAGSPPALLVSYHRKRREGAKTSSRLCRRRRGMKSTCKHISHYSQQKVKFDIRIPCSRHQQQHIATSSYSLSPILSREDVSPIYTTDFAGRKRTAVAHFGESPTEAPYSKFHNHHRLGRLPDKQLGSQSPRSLRQLVRAGRSHWILLTYMLQWQVPILRLQRLTYTAALDLVVNRRRFC